MISEARHIEKYSSVAVCMIVVLAMTIVSVFLHTETNEIAQKGQFQDDWEKSFWVEVGVSWVI